MRTQKEIKLKIGITLPKGLNVEFKPDSPSRCFVFHEGNKYQVRISSAFKAPSMGKLEKMSDDGICCSIAGNNVEPDGWDSEGSPSWLLALGLI